MEFRSLGSGALVSAWVRPLGFFVMRPQYTPEVREERSFDSGGHDADFV